MIKLDYKKKAEDFFKADIIIKRLNQLSFILFTLVCAAMLRVFYLCVLQ